MIAALILEDGNPAGHLFPSYNELSHYLHRNGDADTLYAFPVHAEHPPLPGWTAALHDAVWVEDEEELV